MAVLAGLWTTILDIFFPSCCLSCKTFLDDKSEIICANCRSKIVVNDAFHCSKCNKRLPTNGQNIKKCSCPQSFVVGLAVNYECEPARELVKGLKFGGITKAADYLGDFLGEFIKNADLNLKNFHLIAVPLSKQRLRERGYNQSGLIAQCFVKNTGLSHTMLLNDTLIRIKSTSPQTKAKDYNERFGNVKGCFAVSSPEKIKNKEIILIDDVFTSGATISEAVKTLVASGAKRVIVLCVAKA